MSSRAEWRSVPARRIVNVAIRTAHLISTGAYAGGIVWDAPRERLRLWRNLSIATGAALLVAEASASADWPYQGRGLGAMAHVAVLAPMAIPKLAKSAVTAAALIGVLSSHLPRAIRTWSLLGRPENPR